MRSVRKESLYLINLCRPSRRFGKCSERVDIVVCFAYPPGSGEAQEALQKFTTFLESEAEQGHISRSLEKKVLDVLIASLTDTLTEHPHLVSAAREGLGLNLPKTAGNQLLHQLLLLNPAGASGETASAGTDINKSDKSHQSTLAKTREMMAAAAAESNKAT
uniref:Uncharacterized protein n=1 Tax=Timema poppense TaxID=170557 RepID=A0A7R9HH82_TIMPO|nr:unnamed protein product [Timema poppensis]